MGPAERPHSLRFSLLSFWHFVLSTLRKEIKASRGSLEKLCFSEIIIKHEEELQKDFVLEPRDLSSGEFPLTCNGF